MLTNEINSESTGITISSSSCLHLTENNYIAIFFENKWSKEDVVNIKLWFLKTSPLKVSLLSDTNNNVSVIFFLKKAQTNIDQLANLRISLLKYVDTVLSAIDTEFKKSNQVPPPPISPNIDTESICVLRKDPKKG